VHPQNRSNCKPATATTGLHVESKSIPPGNNGGRFPAWLVIKEKPRSSSGNSLEDPSGQNGGMKPYGDPKMQIVREVETIMDVPPLKY
jgi:hypothetical protein